MATQDAGNIVDLFLSKKDFRLLLVIENLSKVEKAAKGHDSTAVGMGMDINAVHRALSQDNDTLSYKFLCCIFFFLWQRRALFRQYKEKLNRMVDQAKYEVLTADDLVVCTDICKACMNLARNDEFLTQYMNVSICTYNSEIRVVEQNAPLKSRKLIKNVKSFITGRDYQSCLIIMNSLIDKVIDDNFVYSYWSRIVNAEKNPEAEGRVKFRLANS